VTRALLRLYALALHACPGDLRRAHGAEMLQCARSATAASGAAAMPRLFADLLLSICREWLHLLKGLPMQGIGRDVLYALRLLRRTPGFSVAAVVTLALGIGANTAIFTLADATIIRPLRVDHLDRLVAFTWSASLPDYRDWAARTDLFDGVAGVANVAVTVTVDGTTEPTDAAFVSPNYFAVLGVGASAGRVLGDADDPTRGDLTTVIDREWWRTRLRGDPAVIGRTIHVSGAPVTIVGVTAGDFRGTTLSRAPKPLTSTATLLASPFSAPGRSRTAASCGSTRSAGCATASRRRARPRQSTRRTRNAIRGTPTRAIARSSSLFVCAPSAARKPPTSTPSSSCSPPS
jgi:hypothetical protein